MTAWAPKKQSLDEYVPQIWRCVSGWHCGQTRVWHFPVFPLSLSCRSPYGWSQEWREVMRSNRCSDHRYWPKERKEPEQEGVGARNEVIIEHRNRNSWSVTVLPVLERHLTLGWSLQNDWESSGEIYRKPAEQLASWLPWSSEQLWNEKT